MDDMRSFLLVGFLAALTTAACAETEGADFSSTRSGAKDGGGRTDGGGFGAGNGAPDDDADPGSTGWGGDPGQGGSDGWGAGGASGDMGDDGGGWGSAGAGSWGSGGVGGYGVGDAGSFPGIGPGTNMSCVACFGTRCAIDLAISCISSDPLCQCLVACLMVGSNVAPCALDCGANQSAGMLAKATACAQKNCDGCSLP